MSFETMSNKKGNTPKPPWLTHSYAVKINKINGNRLEGVTIFQHEEDKPTRTIIAEWGEVISAPDQKALAIKLYNGTKTFLRRYVNKRLV